jgi:hypothetical protein
VLVIKGDDINVLGKFSKLGEVGVIAHLCHSTVRRGTLRLCENCQVYSKCDRGRLHHARELATAYDPNCLHVASDR